MAYSSRRDGEEEEQGRSFLLCSRSCCGDGREEEQGGLLCSGTWKNEAKEEPQGGLLCSGSCRDEEGEKELGGSLCSGSCRDEEGEEEQGGLLCSCSCRDEEGEEEQGGLLCSGSCRDAEGKEEQGGLLCSGSCRDAEGEEDQGSCWLRSCGRDAREEEQGRLLCSCHGSRDDDDDEEEHGKLLCTDEEFDEEFCSPHDWITCCTLGYGAFARVSLVLHLPTSFLFAAKSAAIAAAPSAELLALRHERHILRSLASPYVVTCLGSHVRGAELHLFLEFMDCGSLADLIRRSGGRLSERRTAEIATAALRGLHYLHRRGIVHGDIKGSNILLNSRGEVKLADFGGAARRNPNASGSGTERRNPDPSSRGPLISGTPLWMAPEVIQGLEQDSPSDIWSFGCTVVEMLQGSPPFFSAASVSAAHVSDLTSALLKLGFRSEPPPLPHSISDHARDFLLCCFHPNPASRWSASELLRHPFLAAAAPTNRFRQVSPLPPCPSVAPLGHRHDLRPFPKSIEQVSPRSVLRMFDHCSSDSEDESSPCGGGLRREAGGWITVRHAHGWTEERQKPFMGGGGGAVQFVMKKGGVLDMEAAMSFLRRRRREKVG